MSRLTALLALVLLAAGPARAAVMGQSTFDFAGTCGDCRGTATAQLVLSNYNPGDAVDDTNFVSFSYGGTNLYAQYTIIAADMPALSGSIAAPLPGTEFFGVATDTIEFVSMTDGSWCTGVRYGCSDDNGTAHLWSVAATTPATVAVGEPPSVLLLGVGVLGVLAVARRKRGAAD